METGCLVQEDGNGHRGRGRVKDDKNFLKAVPLVCLYFSKHRSRQMRSGLGAWGRPASSSFRLRFLLFVAMNNCRELRGRSHDRCPKSLRH
jgi:hypothetical protein